MTKLHGIIQILKKEHDRLTGELKGITAALAAFGAAYGGGNGSRRRISAAGRARIAAAQRARWAKAARGARNNNVVSMPKKRTMSPAARRRIAAAQRARWAQARATKKSA